MDSWLLCDFHIHTRNSDGNFTLKEVIDMYGAYGFGAICVTDHVPDLTTEKLIGESNKHHLVYKDQFEEYMIEIKESAKEAWEKYKLIVIPGYEVTNKDYHILAIDVEKYIDPNQRPEMVIFRIKEQGGLSIVPHPYIHPDAKEIDNPLTYLWENREVFANIVDAWELCNRGNIYTEVHKAGLPYVANSDLHEEEHFYTWKTLVKADKNVESIKAAIRKNKNIGITMLKNFHL